MFIDRPEISIILLTHNRPTGFKKAVDSVYAQTFKKFELIVIDNGNSKDYSDIIKDYLLTKDNLKYIRFQKNEERLGIRLNQGITASNGKYLTFLMDDDELEKDALKMLHKEISKNLDFVYGKVRSRDTSSGRQVRNSYSEGKWLRGTQKKTNPIHITSVMLRRELIDKVGGFHEEMYRSYALDLWNRVFKEAKCSLVKNVVSLVSVNNLGSVTGKRKLDKKETNYEYPLVGYWSKRKSISFLGDERKFIDQINEHNQAWIATHDSPDTDASVVWGYSSEIANYTGDSYYYVDHPMLIQPSMISWCDGVITQFPFDTVKPHHLLRPTVSHKLIKEIDLIPHLLQVDLNILCLKVNADNLDFLKILLEYLADRYSAVFFHLFSNVEAEKMLRGIPNVIPTVIQEDSYAYYKKSNIDMLLHIEGDENSYIDAYKDFITSSIIQAPLVSSPNIAYSDLENGVDIYLCDTLQQFVQSVLKAKTLDIKEFIVRNMRKKTYLHFLDKVVLSNFLLFLNENHTKIIEVDNISTCLNQDISNSSVILHSGECISQTFTSKTEAFSGVSFFGSLLSNNRGSVRFVLKSGDRTLVDKVLPNHTLRNGLNNVMFEEVTQALGEEFIFTLYGDSPIFKVDYNNSIMSEGTFYSNGIPKKACLKFSVLHNT